MHRGRALQSEHMPPSTRPRRTRPTTPAGVVGWLGARLRTTRRRLGAAQRAAEAPPRPRGGVPAPPAHDLKSPLAGIAMTAQLARRRLERLEPATPVTSNLAWQLADV